MGLHMNDVGCYSLYGGCYRHCVCYCSLYVFCYSLYVDCYSRYVGCYNLYVGCLMSYVGCYRRCVGCTTEIKTKEEENSKCPDSAAVKHKNAEYPYSGRRYLEVSGGILTPAGGVQSIPTDKNNNLCGIEGLRSFE